MRSKEFWTAKFRYLGLLATACLGFSIGIGGAAYSAGSESLPFEGTWIPVELDPAQYCNDRPDEHITIRSKSISFWEVSCQIVRLKIEAPKYWRITLKCTEYGEAFSQHEEEFILAHKNEGATAQRLIRITEESTQTYKRCSPHPVETPRQNFEIRPRTDLSGGDYQTIKRTTVDICEATCATQDRCAAFTYNQKAGWCFLKEKLNSERPVNFATSGVKIMSPTYDRPDEVVIKDWHTANESCRGGPGNKEETHAWCDVRKAFGKVLSLRDWCYGQDGEAGYQHEWHKCGADSLKANANELIDFGAKRIDCPVSLSRFKSAANPKLKVEFFEPKHNDFAFPHVRFLHNGQSFLKGRTHATNGYSKQYLVLGKTNFPDCGTCDQGVDIGMTFLGAELSEVSLEKSDAAVVIFQGLGSELYYGNRSLWMKYPVSDVWLFEKCLGNSK